MANINDRDAYNRDNNPNRTPETLNQPGDYHVVKPDPVNYQQGYVEGKALEQQRYEANQEIRDNDNAGRGLLVGILATGLLAIVGASFYFLTQRDRTPVPAVNRTIVVPSAAPSTSPSASPSPEVRERIIERDRVVPVPQQSAPTRVITIPQPSAPAQPAPAQPAPAQPSAPAQSTPRETTPDRSTQPEANDSAQPSSDATKPSEDSTTSSPQPSSGQ
ncbi:MAG: hypothetical protein KME43_07440 [Myxacorys chilensis ATA2-1-KO14]|jgi:hypothetical protein|nr:hypothetical protein [Myxacorys chilensis ATA2-1-KO14]